MTYIETVDWAVFGGSIDAPPKGVIPVVIGKPLSMPGPVKLWEPLYPLEDVSGRVVLFILFELTREGVVVFFRQPGEKRQIRRHLRGLNQEEVENAIFSVVHWLYGYRIDWRGQ